MTSRFVFLHTIFASVAKLVCSITSMCISAQCICLCVPFVCISGVCSRDYWEVWEDSIVFGYSAARHLLWCFYSTYYQQKGKKNSIAASIHSFIIWPLLMFLSACVWVGFRLRRRHVGMALVLRKSWKMMLICRTSSSILRLLFYSNMTII